jgi:hypothetical protein
MPAPIRIRVGGEVDASLGRAFRTAVQLQGQAEKAMQRNKRQTTQAAEGEARKQLRAQESLTRAAESLDRQRARGLMASYRAQEQAAERAAKAQERATARAHAAERRQIEQTAKAAARAIEQERRQRAAAERAMTRRSVRQGESFARRTSHRATRFLMPEAPIGSMAVRALGDAVRGTGVDLSIAGGVGRSTALNSQAIALANQERIATGETRGAAGFESMARRVGDQVATDPGNALRLASTFAARSGAYGSIDSVVPQLASLATAAGADNLEEIGDAAGMVYNQLKLLPDAANKTIAVMRGIVGQTAVGAVEMKDYAIQIGRVAANAFRFEGDVDTNILKLSALTQLSMERGATSAADAARGTAAFSNTFGKSARIKAFHAAGVRLFTDDTKNKDGTVSVGKKSDQMRDSFEIIKDSFRSTNGNIPKLANMFADTLGRKSVSSLGAVYSAAGGGESGVQAVDAAMRHYLKAQLTKETERKNLEDRERGTAAKAQRFQNALDKVTKGVMGELGPALEKVAPRFLELAAVLGSLTTWVVENPKLAIAGAISMAIARAGIESVLRSGIERLMLGPTNAAGVGTRAAGIAGMAGAAGGLLTVAAIGVTTLTVGMAVIDQLFWDAQRQQSEAVNADIGATNATNEALGLAAGGNNAAAAEKAKEAVRLKEDGLKARSPARCRACSRSSSRSGPRWACSWT